MRRSGFRPCWYSQRIAVMETWFLSGVAQMSLWWAERKQNRTEKFPSLCAVMLLFSNFFKCFHTSLTLHSLVHSLLPLPFSLYSHILTVSLSFCIAASLILTSYFISSYLGIILARKQHNKMQSSDLMRSSEVSSGRRRADRKRRPLVFRLVRLLIWLWSHLIRLLTLHGVIIPTYEQQLTPRGGFSLRCAAAPRADWGL